MTTAESGSEYRRLFEAMAQGVVFQDAGGRFRRVNDRTCDILGYPREELLRLTFREITHPEDLAAHQANLERLLAGEIERFTMDQRCLRSDGTFLWTELAATLVTVDDGDPECVACQLVDITERKRSVEALRKSEEFLREVQHIAHIAHWTFDPVSGTTWWSDELYRILGRDPADGPLHFSEHPKFVHPDDWDWFESTVRDTARDGTPFDIFLRILRPGGSERIINSICQPVKDDTGVVVEMRGTIQDVTERKQAESRLKESEERFRKLFENSPFGVMICRITKDARGNPVDFIHLQANPSTSVQLGMDLVDLVGKKATEIADEETAAKFIRLYGEVVTTGTPCSLEYYFSHHDKTLQVTAFPLAGDLFILNFTDISKRKRAEQELRESEERARLMADLVTYSEQPVAVGTLDGRLVRFNPAFCALTGYTEEELLVIDWSTVLTPPEWRRAEREILKELVRTGEPVRYEKEYLRKNGTRVPIELFAHLTRDAAGEPDTVYAFITDITERKTTEAELRESEQRWRDLYESASFGIILFELVTDRAGKAVDFIHLEVNAATTGHTGFEKEKILGKRASEIATPEELGEILPLYERVVKTGTPCHYQRYIRAYDRTLDVTAFLIKGNRFAATFTDISDQVRATEEKRKLESQLRQAQKMESIGTLSGGIAHDFNNILGIIVGNIELALSDVPEWNPARTNLDEVLKASLRARDIVRHILTFSRQSDQEKKAVRLGLIVRETLKMLRATIPTTVEIREELSTEKDTIQADPVQMNQVLLNLCTNAAQAMREDGGVLRVSLAETLLEGSSIEQHPDLEPGEWLVLTVSDTGHGISPGIMDRIFDPYFTTKGLGEGTGMGLAVVHGIVQDHGGTVLARSEEGKGTVVEVYLPPMAGEEERPKEDVQPFPTGSERILLVDDEESLVLLGRRMLEQLRYEVITETSSLKALELFRDEPDRFDLVITDMTMPHMTGADLSLELMRIRPEIPVILCTGFSEMISEEKAGAMGIRAFVTKPMGMRVLAETVRKVLDS